MWTWIYYTIITFAALGICSTVAIITIMGGEDAIKEKEEQDEIQAVIKANDSSTIDIESGEALTYRKKTKSISENTDVGILNF